MEHAISTVSDRITPRFMQWLVKMGFFAAPASARHHLACEGGLFAHSSGVARRLRNLTDALGLVWEREDSPEIIGLFHDLCKIDQYEKVVAEDGTEGYAFKKGGVDGRHGIKSVRLLSDFVELTEEEKACILHHMGAFSDSKEERSAYSEAVRRYPNVLWTHTADMWSSQIDDC